MKPDKKDRFIVTQEYTSVLFASCEFSPFTWSIQNIINRRIKS